MRQIPFDLTAAERMSGWRDSFAWPSPHGEIKRIGATLTAAFLGVLDAIEDDHLRNVALLAGPRTLATGLSLVEAAYWVQQSQEIGLQLAGGPEELYALSGNTPTGTISHTRAASIHVPHLRMPWMRRLIRTASWTPIHRLPATVASPTVTAISHNVLLQTESARSHERIYFHHADSFMAKAQKIGIGVDNSASVAPVLDLLRDVIASATKLNHRLLSLVTNLILDKVRPFLEQADRDLRAIADLPHLPERLWAGTGGYWPARALRIEVRRRDGHVTGFDHAAAAGLIAEVDAVTLGELAVSSRFVAPTETMAKIINDMTSERLTARQGQPEIVGARGDPTFALPLTPRRGETLGRPRVLYVSGAYIGFRQRIPPRIPDVVKMDWQLRLVAALQRMPVDLLCQPHPGGVMRGKIHPIARVAKTSESRFEEVANWADGFVFDVVQSTAFTMALCTNRPIVLIDLGMSQFSPKIQAMIDRRCTVLKAVYDARNLPQVDPEELEHAICSGTDLADPTEFRKLYAGRFAGQSSGP